MLHLSGRPVCPFDLFLCRFSEINQDGAIVFTRHYIIVGIC